MLQKFYDEQCRDPYYYDSVLLKNKKTAAIKIEWLDSYTRKNKDIHLWNVAFGIAKKKKHLSAWFNSKENNITNTITGDGDIEGLIWAKNKLIELNKELSKNSTCSHKICIGWEDNRRRDVYAKYLVKKLGYSLTMDNGYKCLVKNINL